MATGAPPPLTFGKPRAANEDMEADAAKPASTSAKPLVFGFSSEKYFGEALHLTQILQRLNHLNYPSLKFGSPEYARIETIKDAVCLIEMLECLNHNDSGRTPEDAWRREKTIEDVLCLTKMLQRLQHIDSPELSRCEEAYEKVFQYPKSKFDSSWGSNASRRSAFERRRHGCVYICRTRAPIYIYVIPIYIYSQKNEKFALHRHNPS